MGGEGLLGLGADGDGVTVGLLLLSGGPLGVRKLGLEAVQLLGEPVDRILVGIAALVGVVDDVAAFEVVEHDALGLSLRDELAQRVGGVGLVVVRVAHGLVGRAEDVHGRGAVGRVRGRAVGHAGVAEVGPDDVQVVAGIFLIAHFAGGWRVAFTRARIGLGHTGVVGLLLVVPAGVEVAEAVCGGVAIGGVFAPGAAPLLGVAVLGGVADGAGVGRPVGVHRGLAHGEQRHLELVQALCPADGIQLVDHIERGEDVVDGRGVVGAVEVRVVLEVFRGRDAPAAGEVAERGGAVGAVRVSGVGVLVEPYEEVAEVVDGLHLGLAGLVLQVVDLLLHLGDSVLEV